ncbi:MAG TPA: chorismate mutase [Acidocella sp.]|nr:chorismate mutase [Acidocella sp.]HQU03158.1 chorismate mutase [Acidocella sp.]
MSNDISAPDTLVQLRAELDALDNEMHALLMRRAGIIERVARDGGKHGTKIRPGREASMVRRLLAQHRGTLPPQSILRIWREIFAAALIIEGGQTVAVCAPDESCDIPALAREHFGPLTPMRRHRNPLQTLSDIESGAAQVAVVPPPSDEPDGAWWTALMGRGNTQLSIIAKLPFWTQRAEGTPLGDAYVVAAIRPDPSGHDRGLLALEVNADTSRARLTSIVNAAGFNATNIWLKRRGDFARALVEVEGLVDDNDARLLKIHGLDAPAITIGGFAVPLDGTP